MSLWKCPHCKRERIKSDNIISSQCVCGDYYVKIEEKNFTNRKSYGDTDGAN